MEEKIPVKKSLHGHLYSTELEEAEFCNKHWLLPSMMTMIGQTELNGKIIAYEILDLIEDEGIAKAKLTELPAKIESKRGFAVDTIKVIIQTPCGRQKVFTAKYPKHPWHLF